MKNNVETMVDDSGKPANNKKQNSPKMNLARKFSLAAGILYLITFISIPTLSLYRLVQDPNYITGSGPDAPIILGTVLELIMALACIGTAVALYPVVKRQNEGIALGFVGARILEASTIFAGVVCLLSLVTLRQAGAGASDLVTGHALFAQYSWFRLGQNLMPAVNALLLGYLLYRSRLVPRILPILGFIGAPLLIANTIVSMYGFTGLAYTLTGIGVIPIALWEFSLGVWLTVKGFNPAAVASLNEKTTSNDLLSVS